MKYQPMRQRVKELVTRLVEEGPALSRNRHFDLFESPEARRALHLYKRLRRLERDLRECARRGRIKVKSGAAAAPPHAHRAAGGSGAVDSPPEEAAQPRQFVIEMEIPAVRFKRQVFMDADEMALLRLEPEVDALLNELAAG